MSDEKQRREQAKRDAQARYEEEKRVEYEREAMRRMDAPQWAIALRLEQLQDE